MKRLIENMNLEKCKDKQLMDLSKDEMLRMSIAIALIGKP